MTRAEVAEQLRLIADKLTERVLVCAVNRAIELLAPPTTEEIREARLTMLGWDFLSDPRGKIVSTLRRALDALEREPEFESDLQNLRQQLEEKDGHCGVNLKAALENAAKVNALEKVIERVRAFRNSLNGSGCAWEDSIKPFRDAVDAALAADSPSHESGGRDRQIADLLDTVALQRGKIVDLEERYAKLVALLATLLKSWQDKLAAIIAEKPLPP